MLKNDIFWAAPINQMYGGYIEFVLAAVVNLLHYNNEGSLFSNVNMVVMIVLLVLFPLWVWGFLYWNWGKLTNGELTTYKDALSDFDLKYGSKSDIWVTVIFILRRIILILALTLVKTQTFQLFIFVFISLSNLIFLLVAKPHDNRYYLTLFNEYCVYITCVSLFCFTDAVPTKYQEKLGYYLSGLTAI